MLSDTGNILGPCERSILSGIGKEYGTVLVATTRTVLVATTKISRVTELLSCEELLKPAHYPGGAEY